jgi:hypothetical protein
MGSSSRFMRQTLLLSMLSILLAIGHGSSSSGAVLHICNRGFCFNKREVPLSPAAWHLAQLRRFAGTRKRVKGIVDFCSSSDAKARDAMIDCELFSILGAERVDREFEALECPKGRYSCQTTDEILKKESPMEQSNFGNDDVETIELDTAGRGADERHWPVSGKCYDNEQDYEFDCNLVQIIE